MDQDAQARELQRVAVIGTSCSGKTTFARELSAILGASHIELDALYWQPRWVERRAAEFRALVERETSAERWVADGNYSPVRDIVWGRATDIVWLNYSFPLVFSRAVLRTVRRAFTREELFSGNRESLRQSFLSRDSILLWVLKTFRRNQARYATLQNSGDWRHVRFREYRRPAHASAFLSRCGAAAQGAAADGQRASRAVRG